MSPTSRKAPPSQQDSLRKILDLEKQKGYKDTAVIGGLDRFLEGMGAEFAATVGDGAARELLNLSYDSMTDSQRRDWVDRFLSRLEAIGAGDRAHIASSTGPGSTARKDAASGKPAPALPGPTPVPPKPHTASPATQGISLESPVDRLRGVDVKLSAKLLRLGVSTIKDILYLFPRRHNDFSEVAKINELTPGQEKTVVATVWEARVTSLGRGKLKATEAVVSDETGNMRVLWIGNPYIARQLKPNSKVVLSGHVEAFRGQLQLQSPEFEVLDKQESLIHTGRLVPVYPLTEGLAPRRLRGILWQALEQWVPQLGDFLPQATRDRAGLISLSEAIRQTHYPDGIPSLQAAHRRLAFDEFFLLQMAVQIRRSQWQEVVQGMPISSGDKVLKDFIASLPFGLTGAQQRCMEEIMFDMKRGTPPMNRILQGEVGSGKTVVALAAMLVAAAGGHQASIMVPTEVLAEQHFSTISGLLGGLARPVMDENLFTVYLDSHRDPVSVALITGSTRGPLKKELQQQVSEGKIDIIIGTHALIQEGVEIPKLALAVTDEQQRFGVSQRAALRQKGTVSPHFLVMSATPIPRTLALTLYGNLDISTIDQLPPGRQRVLTRQVPPERRYQAYSFVRNQVLDGRQAFVIFPLIEESEAIEARAATEEFQRLSTEVFPDLRLGLLHGRMKPRAKEEAMRRFRDGETDILVSTPVVEVGIDVPNATAMVVEGAHRFGLSQLHQFRGRVGRGAEKSYCLLISEYSSPEAAERLSAVERTHDGFQLAEVDLSMRGPGDYFGTRQSGLPDLKVARLSDQELLKLAREEAVQIMTDDPGLQDPSHEPLAREVARYLDKVGGEVS